MLIEEHALSTHPPQKYGKSMQSQAFHMEWMVFTNVAIALLLIPAGPIKEL